MVVLRPADGEETVMAWKVALEEERPVALILSRQNIKTLPTLGSLRREEATMGRMAAALRRLGFDHVFDTNFTADLTIMEEGNEFLHRLTSGGLTRWPMFTSCCPGWVRFLKSQYPELTRQLSTAKSPQQMFGSVAKSWYAQKLGVSPEKIYCVSIMPCVAK